MYTLWYSGNPASPPFRPFGVNGAPTKTHRRNPLGTFNFPSGVNTAAEPSACATAGCAWNRAMLVPSKAIPAKIADTYSLFCIVHCPFRLGLGRSLRAEDRITFDVDPIVLFCGYVATEAIPSEISRDLPVPR